MKGITKKIIILLLAIVMLVTIAACKKTLPEAPPEEIPSPAPSTDNGQDEPTPTPTPSDPKPKLQTLVVGYDFFSQKFSPFFYKTAYDMEVQHMTGEFLVSNDRVGNMVLNGISGETLDFNGTNYFYDGIADIKIVQNSNGTVDYNVKLREDIVFSDGEKMTIDDVIFNMYVYCDPKYDGGFTLFSLPITGLLSYRAGVTAEIYEKYEELGSAIFDAGPENEDYSGWTKEQQDAFWGTHLDQGGEMFVKEIVDVCVADYSAYMSDVSYSEVALGMYAWGFGEPDDDGVFITEFSETEFDLPNGEEPTLADYWAEMLVAYGMDFDGINEESAGTPIEDFVISAFISGEGPKDPEAGGEITSIAGIKRTGDYTCTVTTDYFEASSIYQFIFEVAPLHYYGDKNLYDYNNNKFGFPKGDLSIMKSKTTAPMGAGPYKFLSYESGVVSYEANPLYYKGEPKIKYLRFQEVPESDKLAGIVAGTFDITNPSFSQDVVGSIKKYNSNGEITGDKIVTNTVDNLGYGYIGIAANNVQVGGELSSKASRDLRTAFATLYAVHRATVNNSYYGERASVIQYPISNTSWAAPRPNDDGYREAYSIDVDGKSIYNDTMTIEQRYSAALQAAIGFFKSAGYTWDEASGKFTAAPAGAQMAYEVLIPAGGGGDHPAFGILTAAKENLATIGITLEINDPSDSNVLWQSIESGQAEMWCAAWQATIDPDMYQVYHSSNVVGAGGTDSNSYNVADDELDELIIEARRSADQSFRKATYKRCLEIIMEWAVEVPNYQRQNAIIFSPERVNMATVTPDITTFYEWWRCIDQFETNS